MTNHVALREFIETIIKMHIERLQDLRAEDHRRLKDALAARDEALLLQAKAYPTVKDFNDLKTHVDVEMASRSGSSNSVTTLFQVLTVLSVVFSAVLGFLVYFRH